MNSKEALKLAILEYEKDLEFDENNQWVKNVLKGLKECQQGLDRSEKLEKVIDILKEVLKMGFIFKFGENIGNGGYISITKIDCNNTTIVNIRKEEYDLLKEVLEDDR